MNMHTEMEGDVFVYSDYRSQCVCSVLFAILKQLIDPLDKELASILSIALSVRRLLIDHFYSVSMIVLSCELNSCFPLDSHDCLTLNTESFRWEKHQNKLLFFIQL